MSKSTHPEIVDVRKCLGVTLKFIRTDLGLSQRQVAARCGLNQTTISLIERGATCPTLETLAALRLAYGQSLNLEIDDFVCYMAEAQQTALEDSQPSGEHE